MNAPLTEVCCACLPSAALPWLASLRVHAGVRVRRLGDRVWLWWTAGDEMVLQRVLALHGAELFALRGGRWHRPGQRVPAFNVPAEDGARPLLHVLTPAPVQPFFLPSPPEGGSGVGGEGGESLSRRPPHPLPRSPEAGERGETRRNAVPLIGAASFRAVPLRLVRDNRPHAASALCCDFADLAAWAEQATRRQLALLAAIRCGERLLLRGGCLPPLTTAERYWGQTILTPLGFRPEPEVSEGTLREALRLQDEEIALLGEDGFEAIDGRLFQPLTRAGVRLALREVC